MWRELILKLYPEATFKAPASLEQIAEAESTLNIVFPHELKTLLMESDGVGDTIMIRSVKAIEDINLYMRNDKSVKALYMPFDSFLFFANGGNGDLYAFSIINGIIDKPDIFLWDHEYDSRTYVDPNLKAYITRWLSLPR